MKQIIGDLITILYEDDHLMILNKPPHVVVNRAESVKNISIQDMLKDYLAKSKVDIFKQGDKLFSERLGMVHRLDKETSGILVWAKHPKSMNDLLRQFRERLVKKSYTALVHGKLEPKSGFIGLPIGRDVNYRGRFCIDPFGKSAYTDYIVDEWINGLVSNKWYSLITLKPKTGRTHQIRVHLKHLNHPLVSDRLYLSRKALNQDLVWCPRLFLHASALKLCHPVTGEILEFSSDLTDDLVNALKDLF